VSDILIIVPSRTRHWNIDRLIGAWGETGAWGTADLRIDIDANDPAHDRYRAINLPPGARMHTWDTWMPCMHKLEAAAAQEVDSYFALGFMGDDHLPRTVGWAQRWLQVLREMGTGIVYGRDGYQDERCPTQWATTCDIVRATGRLCPSPVEHLWSDTAVYDLGKAADCIRYLPDTFIEHMHYVVGKAPRDFQYERVNSRDQWDRDEAIYRAWQRDQLPADAAAVRALMEVTHA
jgi:hypothetical protein